jgi:hypothetical protein
MGLRSIARRLSGTAGRDGAGRPYPYHSPNSGPLPGGAHRPAQDDDLDAYDSDTALAGAGPAEPEPDDGDRPGDGEQ